MKREYTYPRDGGPGVLVREIPGVDDLVNQAARASSDAIARVGRIETRLADIERRLSAPGVPTKVSTPDTSKQFRNFGDFLLAVRRAEMGGQPDPRLESRAAGLNGNGDPSEGGYLLPADFSDALTDLVFYGAPIASRCLRFDAKRRSCLSPLSTKPAAPMARAGAALSLSGSRKATNSQPVNRSSGSWN
jgi:hypothetical protein